MTVDLLPDPGDEQQMLLDTSARLMDTAMDLAAVRRRVDGSEVDGAGYARAAAELGWWGFLAAEAQGGGSASGNGVLDASLIAAERGARLQPLPFVGHSVVVHCLSRVASRDHDAALADLVAGASSATWISGAHPDGDPAAGLALVPQGSGHRLDGVAEVVPDGPECAWFLVTADGPSGPAQVLVAADGPGVHVRTIEGFDATRRWATVTFDAVPIDGGAQVAAPGLDTAVLIGEQVAIAAVLAAAETVGAMHAEFAMALAYAKDRIAFGRPIGSFQAIKHLLADTSLLLEMSKGLVAGAARAVGAGAPDGFELAHAAKAFVGERGVELTQSCFQVFGGIGYTWEHDHHLFMRRVAADAACFGSPTWHRRQLGRSVGAA